MAQRSRQNRHGGAKCRRVLTTAVSRIRAKPRGFALEPTCIRENARFPQPGLGNEAVFVCNRQMGTIWYTVRI